MWSTKHRLASVLWARGANDEAEALLPEGVRVYAASDVAGRTSPLKVQAILGYCLALRAQDRAAAPLLTESHSALAVDSVVEPRGRVHAEAGLGLVHARRGHAPGRNRSSRRPTRACCRCTQMRWTPSTRCRPSA